MFSLNTKTDKPDLRALMTILGRSGESDWTFIDLAPEAPSLKACLAWPAADIAQVAQGTAALTRGLAAAWDPAKRPGGERPPAQEPWLRATATALAPFQALEEAGGVTAERIGDLTDQDSILRAIAHYGGRIKDGALDARLFVGGFGWFLVSLVLDGLRAAVAGKPQKEAEAILAPFAPMLVVIGRMMEEREAKAHKTRDATEALTQQVQEAQVEREVAAAQLKLRGEPPLPHETLVELAKKAGPPPPPPPRRRTRR